MCEFAALILIVGGLFWLLLRSVTISQGRPRGYGGTESGGSVGTWFAGLFGMSGRTDFGDSDFGGNDGGGDFGGDGGGDGGGGE